MSITLTFYEIFSFLIPGIFYLYIINEFFILFSWNLVDLKVLPDGLSFILFGALAFILGHLFYSLSNYIGFLNKAPNPKEALERIKRRYPYLHIGYKPEEYSIIYGSLEERNDTKDPIHQIERHVALSMMFQNICFAFMFFITLQIATVIFKGISLDILVLIILSAIFSIRSIRNSWGHESFSIEMLFIHGLAYGNNLEAFLTNNQPKWSQEEFRKAIIDDSKTQ